MVNLRKIFLLFVVNSFVIYCFSEENIAFLFAHGLGGNKDQVNHYDDFINGKSYSFDFPEVVYQDSNLPYKKYLIDSKKVNLAQQDDIDSLKKAHEEIISSNQATNGTVLIGVSRGASAIIDYTAKNSQNLKALILESPFDTVENVVNYQLERRFLHWIPMVKLLVDFGVYHFVYPGYNKNGIKPIDSITKIKEDLPILFVHSKVDKLISLKSSMALYRKLREKGHKHVYILELDSGEHANYQFGSDYHKYLSTVHAFYKKYGIPHDEQLAICGENFLSQCQPLMEIVVSEG